MNFDNIINMRITSYTCPVIHLNNGLYVTCTSFIPNDNNGSMLFYYQNCDTPIEISGTYDNLYTYDSNTQTWGMILE